MNVIPSCSRRSEKVAFSLKNPYLYHARISLAANILLEFVYPGCTA